MRDKLSEVEKEALITRYQNRQPGETQAYIARIYHISPRTCARYLEEAGVTSTKGRRRDEMERVARLLRKYDLNADTLSVILKDHAAGQSSLFRDSCAPTKPPLFLPAEQVRQEGNPATNGVVINQDLVQEFLNKSSKEQLAAMFYTAGLIKIAESISTTKLKAPKREQDAPIPNYRQR